MALPEIVGAAEAADILGIGNTNFSHLRKQRAGTDNAFPEPATQLKCGPIWLKRDVDKYAKTFTPGRRPAAVKEKAPEKPAAKTADARKVAASKKVAAPAKAAPKRLAGKRAPSKKAPAKKLALVK